MSFASVITFMVCEFIVCMVCPIGMSNSAARYWPAIDGDEFSFSLLALCIAYMNYPLVKPIDINTCCCPGLTDLIIL
ncbi:hypothetical protein I3842_12G028300 [Carya illinoinensis]|uniref:Uncharacterized protein n=1 Tax=Carya illinoinensis TaxID=32201 RepID=A0A922DG53_CARIL|nr:hypothetical protein I3842_12G028300 [Carya illinoinensis]